MSQEIWFCGLRLDHRNADPPIVIRGYDRAGNQIYRVRYTDDAGGVYELWNGYQDRWYFPAWLPDGTPVTAWHPGAKPPRSYPYRLATSAEGLLYCASGPVLEGSGPFLLDFFRVYHRNGDRVPFPQLHHALIRALAVGDDGSIYVGGDMCVTDRAHLRRYSAAGEEVWSAGVEPWAQLGDEETIYDVVIGADGDLYCVGGRYYVLFVRRISSATGATVWTRWLNALAETAPSVCVRGGDVYVAGGIPNGYLVPPGIEVIPWIAGEAHYFGVVGFRCADGEWFAAGLDLDANDMGTSCSISAGPAHIHARCSDYQMRLLDPATLATVSAWPSAADRQCRAASDGRTYCSGRRRITAYWNIQHFHCYGPAGELPWGGLSATSSRGVNQYGELRPTDNEAGLVVQYSELEYVTPYGVLAGPDIGPSTTGFATPEFWGSLLVSSAGYEIEGAADVHVDELPASPSLAFALALRVPGAPAMAALEGIPIQPSIRLPVWRMDYAETQCWAYLLELGGAPSLWLPASSISIRRDASSATASVVVPTRDAALAAGALERRGSMARIWRAMRRPAGLDSLCEVLAFPADTIRSDRGGSKWSLTLSGTTPVDHPVSRPRELRGISYRSGGFGARRARCAVDIYLAPGDTALLGGGETLVVGSLSISISATSANMEVSE